MKFCTSCGRQLRPWSKFCSRCGLAITRLQATGSLASVATMLWIGCGSCSGESMAILGAEGPGKGGHNLLDFLEQNHVKLLWHPSLSLESPEAAAGIVERIIAGEVRLTLLCVEGSIIHGPRGTGMFDTFRGKPKRDVVAALCDRADFVLAMGTCAAFGGIPAAPPNPTESGGLQFNHDKPGGLLGAGWRSKTGLPVLNLAGCPVDAATMTKTMAWVLKGLPLELDMFNRPFTVGPCLSDAVHNKCGTAEQVGYACYGCIGAKFPVDRPLFKHMEQANKQVPFGQAAKVFFHNYGRRNTDGGVRNNG